MRLFFVFGLIFYFHALAFGHPGQVDSKGGHTCYTNCEKYGLEYGEYHTHQTTPPPQPTPKPFNKDTVSTANIDDDPISDAGFAIPSILLAIGAMVLLIVIAIPLALLGKLLYYIRRKRNNGDDIQKK